MRVVWPLKKAFWPVAHLVWIAAAQEAEQLTEDDLMVVICPILDRYLGKIFSKLGCSHGFDTNAPEPVAPQRIGTAYLDGTDPADTDRSSRRGTSLRVTSWNSLPRKPRCYLVLCPWWLSHCWTHQLQMLFPP